MNLPDTFIHNVTAVLKEQAQAWFEQLPMHIEACINRWQLKDLHIMPNLTYNFVARAQSTLFGKSVVLKVCLSEVTYAREEAALRYFEGKGCVKLLAAESTIYAMLLEDIQPGTTLKALWPEHDLQAVTMTAALIKQMHTKAVSLETQFRTVEQRLTALNDCSDMRMPQRFLEKAKDLAHKLIASQGDLYVLHGDLHHENILLGQNDSWTTIDPQGVVGELAYEVGSFMCDPFPALSKHPDAKNLISRRINLFAELLNLDRQRIADWSYVQAVLAIHWTLKNNLPDWQDWITCAGLCDEE